MQKHVIQCTTFKKSRWIAQQVMCAHTQVFRLFWPNNKILCGTIIKRSQRPGKPLPPEKYPRTLSFEWLPPTQDNDENILETFNEEETNTGKLMHKQRTWNSQRNPDEIFIMNCREKSRLVGIMGEKKEQDTAYEKPLHRSPASPDDNALSTSNCEHKPYASNVHEYTNTIKTMTMCFEFNIALALTCRQCPCA